jgi:hypothetical protein
MADSLLKTVEIDGVVYMEMAANHMSDCAGCTAYDNPPLCDALRDHHSGGCTLDPIVYVRKPSRWLEGTEPRCVGVRSFSFGAEVCPQRHDCERFLDLARPVPTKPTYLEMWLCTPEKSAFLPVSTPNPEGEAPV